MTWSSISKICKLYIRCFLFLSLSMAFFCYLSSHSLGILFFWLHLGSKHCYHDLFFNNFLSLLCRLHFLCINLVVLPCPKEHGAQSLVTRQIWRMMGISVMFPTRKRQFGKWLPTTWRKVATLHLQQTARTGGSAIRLHFESATTTRVGEAEKSASSTKSWQKCTVTGLTWGL